MSDQRGLILRIPTIDPKELNRKTFQLHYEGDDLYRAYEVTLEKPDDRCPVIVGGERCGDKAGHDGKHEWGRGD